MNWMYPEVRLGTVGIHDVTTSDVVALVRESIARHTQLVIATPNANYVVKSGRDAQFRAALAAADVRVSDGMGVVFASRLLGRGLRELVGGRLLVDVLCAEAAAQGWRVTFFGGRANVATRCAAVARSRWPGIRARGIDVGEVDPGVVPPELRGIATEILFVGLGGPKQEELLVWHRSELAFAVGVGVGGSFDSFAGRLRTPPRWATSIGLEWIFRVLSEPRRLGRRYLTDLPRFLWIVIREALISWHRR